MESVTPKKKLKELLEHFDIVNGDYSFEQIQQGYINETFLVLKNSAPVYILQRINDEVFTNVPALMANVGKALTYLSDNDYELVPLIPTKTGEFYCKFNNEEYWRVFGYIPNSIAYNNAENTTMAFEAGKILGKFHSLLLQAPAQHFADTIPRFHDLQLRKDQFKKAVNKASQEKLLEAKAAISFVEGTLPILEELSTLDLPIRICHNDTKLNNILFSKTSNEALCLIDLDTIMKGHFYYDFGDLVRTIANTAKEDEKNHQKITFNRPLFESFLDGLATSSAFLTTKELKSLSLGIVFMPFIHGLRALTDYLNNNQYYKVTYPNQNLDRSLSLLDFSKKALSEINYIEDIVHRKLHPIST